MPLNFPASPVDGQAYDNWIYSSSKGAWLAKPLEPMAAVPSPTAPLNPTNGDMWFNTVDGTTYVWYDDGNTAQWVEMVAPISANGYYSPNYVINGGFDIWQRGTSQSTTGYGSADRWKVDVITATAITRASASTSYPTIPGNYLLSMGTTNATNSIVLAQTLESTEVSQLRGKIVTLSFYAAGASGTSLSAYIQKATTADNSAAGWSTISATFFNLTAQITRYSITGIIPTDSSATGLRVAFSTNNNPNASTVNIMAVQLEQGSTATPFRRNANSIQGELAACQRYYVRFNPSSLFGAVPVVTAGATSTTSILANVALPFQMRINPSSVESLNLRAVNLQDNTPSAISAIILNDAWQSNIHPTLTITSSGLTANAAYRVGANNTLNAYLALNAEL